MTSPFLILLTLAIGVCLSLFASYLFRKGFVVIPPKVKTLLPFRKPPSSSTTTLTARSSVNNNSSSTDERHIVESGPPQVIMEGTLRKRPRTTLVAKSLGWQKRYFVANGLQLCYYKDEKRTCAARPVEYKCVSCAADVITLELDKGCMYLLADSEKDAQMWVNHLTGKGPQNDGPLSGRAVSTRPPANVTGAWPPTQEELNLLKMCVAEFRRIAQVDITDWCARGSELAIAVRDYDRAVERFLWAREFNVTNAIAMWRETVLWRDTKQLDTILDAPYLEASEIKRVYPGRYHGFDKLGRLLYIEDTGSLDLPALMRATDIDGMLKYHLSTMEFMCKYGFPQSCVVGADPSMDQIVTILNLKGLHIGLLKPQVMKYLKMVMDVDQGYYPECLGKTFIVNAPRIFSTVWNIVKPWLAPRVISKIDILGEVKEGSPALLALIDADQLPTYLGGTCECQMSTDCPHTPGQLMRDFLRMTEMGRTAFDKEHARPTKKFGFGKT